MGSFLYPRTITLSRSSVSTELGAAPYSGETPSEEQTLVEGIPASIQYAAKGSRPDAGLPADMVGRSFWRVIIPLGALAQGVVRTRDIVTDDLGVRYAVLSPWWDSLGYSLVAERLEA